MLNGFPFILTRRTLSDIAQYPIMHFVTDSVSIIPTPLSAVSPPAFTKVHPLSIWLHPTPGHLTSLNPSTSHPADSSPFLHSLAFQSGKAFLHSTLIF